MIRKAIEDWAAAVSNDDRSAILAGHDDDLLMFDLPSTVRGIDADNETGDFFFFDQPQGPIKFVPHDLDVTAGADVAFATCVIGCDGTSAGPLELRLTTGSPRSTVDGSRPTSITRCPPSKERYIGPSVDRT